MSESTERLRRNVSETKIKHEKTPYFDNAEKYIEAQWNAYIADRIAGADFTRVLELAPGHGRNTARLVTRATEMYLVDINQGCIDACRTRFGDRFGACDMHYAVTDGITLPGVPDEVITFVYTWDSMVHFDREVVEKYVHEFARVMTPGARGFVHHSNFGNLTADPDANWLDNPHWRSSMKREDMVKYCADAGLRLDKQDLIPWGNVRELDCISLISKPG